LLIRPAQPDDAPSLAALAIQVWLDTYAPDGVRTVLANYVFDAFTPAAFAAWIADPSQRLIVAERQGHLIGYARLALGERCAMAAGSTAELVTLYVVRHFAGQGVGAALLKAAQAGRAQPLWFRVYAHNERAIAFYRKQGCVEVGTTHFELDGERHPNLVFITPPAAERAPVELPESPQPGLRVVELTADRVPALQRFFDANPGYFNTVLGTPAGPLEAHETVLGELPAGWPFSKKWVIGFVNEAGELVAMADVVSDLLATGVWHIGLFMVA
jgi:ribosomal protein S18 acetylase RimI-like enzyme